MKEFFRKVIRQFIRFAYPELAPLNKDVDWGAVVSSTYETQMGRSVKLYAPFHISNCCIGNYSYIARNSWISHATIGKFCSIGPNVIVGWGIHPADGISTSPMFYSTMKQNGMTLSDHDKIEERKPIVIGNDVFIGANVTILDGVTIGNGAIIGAGAVVSKDIPPYAVAVGCPIQILRYRHNEHQREALQRIQWWNFEEEELKKVEQYFFDINEFIKASEQELCRS